MRIKTNQEASFAEYLVTIPNSKRWQDAGAVPDRVKFGASGYSEYQNTNTKQTARSVDKSSIQARPPPVDFNKAGKDVEHSASTTSTSAFKL